MENSLRDPYRPLWISGHAIWPSQRPLRIFQDFMHEGAPRVPPSLRSGLHRWHPDLLSELGRTSHHVAEVLQRLHQYQLFLKAEKCSFHQSSVQFLGYHIDSGGIRMDEGRWKLSRPGPNHSTIKELQRFLGFSNFYRRFIQNYSTLTSHSPTFSVTSPSLCLVPSSRGGLWEAEGSFHPSSNPRTSRSSKTIHCWSRCFDHGGRSDPFTAAGETPRTPSCAFFHVSSARDIWERQRG